jgi:hypothetical protein
MIQPQRLKGTKMFENSLLLTKKEKRYLDFFEE